MGHQSKQDVTVTRKNFPGGKKVRAKSDCRLIRVKCKSMDTEREKGIDVARVADGPE